MRKTAENTSNTSKKPAARAKRIALDAHVRIGQTRELKSKLAKILQADSKKISIDGSKVEKIDSSALQLLTAFAIDAGKKSKEINWTKPSESLVSSASMLGLTKILKLN